MRVIKWLGLGLATLFVLVVLTYGVLLVINRADEPPSAIALAFAELIDEVAAPYQPENAVPYFAGLRAGRGVDPRAVGEAWLDWSRLSYEEQLAQDAPGGGVSLRLLIPSERPALDDLMGTCGEPQPACLSLLDDQSAALSAELAELDWLMARYDRLLRHSAWQEPATESYLSIPAYGEALTLNQLFGLHVWRLAHAGEVERALDELDREALFWRMALVETRLLVGKMLIAEMLKRNMLWTNAVLRKADYAGHVPMVWQQELTPEERSMQRSFAGELHLAASEMTQRTSEDLDLFDALLRSLENSLFQPQATANLFAARYHDVHQALSVPYPQLEAELNRLREREQEMGEAGIFRLYNPVGHIFGQMTSGSHAHYGLRIADLEGLRRLMLLADALRDGDVAAPTVPSRLAGAEFRNPYTGDPFSWDADSKALIFNGLAPGENGLYTVPY